MKITRRVFLASGAAMAAVATDYLTRSGASHAQAGTLNLYSARHYDTDNEIYKSFTQKTGIKVRLIEAEAGKLIERIKSEQANSPADVLLTVDAGNLWRAQSEGLLLPVSTPALQKIPANLREPSGQWFGFSKRARVIVYNKDKVKPSDLASYEDLATGKWKNRLIVRSSNNVYNQSLVGALLAALGDSKTEAWAKGLVENFARPPEGNDTAQIKAVAAGVADVSLVNTYYMVRLAKSTKPEDKEVASKVGIFFPNQKDRGTHVNISGGGVVKTSKNQAAAIKFLEHLASPEVQKMFAEGNNEYPVVSGVPVDSVLASYGRFKEDKLNASVYGSKNKSALEVMNRVGWK